MYRVLLVEDDKDTSEVELIFLRGNGYDVLLAETAQDAERLLSGEKLDVVVLDLSVIKDRAQFVSLIQAKDVPLIICSAANDKKVIAAFQSVLTYSLKKPFEMDELLRVVKSACESRIKP